MKFISEMGAGDAEEMRRHVFGQNYRTDANGNPLEACAMVPAYAKRFPDRAEAHCMAYGRRHGADAEKRERTRLGVLASNHSLALVGAEI
jgi:hypothetical protein